MTKAGDDELIRLCGELIAANDKENALYNACRSIDDEKLIEAEAKGLADLRRDLCARIVAIHPATPAGIVAKAKAASKIACRDFDDAVQSTGLSTMLAWSLIEGLAGRDHRAVVRE